MSQICFLKDFSKNYDDVLFYHFGELEIHSPYKNLYEANGFIFKKDKLYIFRAEVYLFQGVNIQLDVYLVIEDRTHPAKTFNDFDEDEYFDTINYEEYLLPFIIKTIDNENLP
jgi:hypothetical protein